MTNKKKIVDSEAFEFLPKSFSSVFSVKERSLPDSQKQVIFEDTILKDYRRKNLCRKLKLSLYGGVAVAAALSLWLVPDWGNEKGDINLYGNLISLNPGKDVTIVNESCTMTYSAGISNIVFDNGKIIVNGKDSVSVSSSVNYILVPDMCQSIVKFQDGTKVIMNSGSRLAVPSDFSSRRVAFSGEGIFNVVHDEAHPFIVDAGFIRTKVFGTEFLINNYPSEAGHACIALFSGKLSVDMPSLDREVILSPEEMVSIIGQSYIKTSGIPDDLGQWKPADVLELDESLEMILQKVARYYGIDVKCKDSMEDVLCHGRIALPECPSDFFEVLSALTRVKYEFSNDNNVIVSKY